MFQFPGFPPHALCIYASVTGLPPAGFPHSDIKGSMPACGSPLLFAACHVLLRRLVPWHPPCALLRLITLLRRRYNFLRSIDFLNLQLVFQDFSRLLLCAVVKVRGRFLSLQASFRNPENDTVLRATVISLDFSALRAFALFFSFTEFLPQSTSV